jgi:serine/threonine protein phosphatase PrpC
MSDQPDQQAPEDGQPDDAPEPSQGNSDSSERGSDGGDANQDAPISTEDVTAEDGEGAPVDLDAALHTPTIESPAPFMVDDDMTQLGPGATPGFGVGGLSDVGRVRELNEDNWHWEPLDGETALYAVADGMGGHDKGEVASQVAVETLFREARAMLAKEDRRGVKVMRALLRDAMQAANRGVVRKGEEQDSNMGTTLCAALVHGEKDAYIANVGDSRVYMVDQGVLRQVSDDHSLVSYLVQLGELTAEEARNHPSGNILVRSIGSVPEVEIDLFHVELKPGDRLMLCSDGLWGEVDDPSIARLMHANSNPQAACQALVDLANENGGRDNTTLVVVNV